MKTIITTICSNVGFTEDIQNVYNNGGISSLGSLKVRHKFISYFNEEEEYIMEEYKNDLNELFSEAYVRMEDGECDEIDCNLEVINIYDDKINIYNLLKP